MALDINSPLIEVTDQNTFPADINTLENLFTKPIVDDAIAFLNYRDVEELPKTEDPNYPILYVFRHGQTIDNKEMIFSGWRDAGLTQTGINQALILSDKLKDKKIDVLYSSDMIRAIDTMKHAMSKNTRAENVFINQDRRLRERTYGDWQGYSKLKKHLEEPKVLEEVRRGYDARPPHGESLRDTVDRVSSFLAELLPMMKTQKINVAISCHGNSIRGIRQYFEKLDNDATAIIETPLGQDYAAYSIK